MLCQTLSQVCIWQLAARTWQLPIILMNHNCHVKVHINITARTSNLNVVLCHITCSSIIGTLVYRAVA